MTEPLKAFRQHKLLLTKQEYYALFCCAVKWVEHVERLSALAPHMVPREWEPLYPDEDVCALHFLGMQQLEELRAVVPVLTQTIQKQYTHQHGEEINWTLPELSPLPPEDERGAELSSSDLLDIHIALAYTENFSMALRYLLKRWRKSALDGVWSRMYAIEANRLLVYLLGHYWEEDRALPQDHPFPHPYVDSILQSNLPNFRQRGELEQLRQAAEVTYSEPYRSIEGWWETMVGPYKEYLIPDTPAAV